MDDAEGPDPVAAWPIVDQAVVDTSQVSDHLASPDESDGSQSLFLLEESAVVSKHRVVTGRVKIETRTELRQESADLVLDRQVVDITRVAVNRVIENTPEVRTEGDTTIVPVVEERFVVVKQFFLKEELHIRHRTEHVTLQHVVELRRQSAAVERFDAEGRIISPGNDL